MEDRALAWEGDIVLAKQGTKKRGGPVRLKDVNRARADS